MAETKEVLLRIDNQKIIQDHFRGAGGIYHAYAYRADFPEYQYTEEECDIEIERVRNMELKIARTYFDLMAYQDGKWNWDSEDMLALYKWLDKMQQFGVEVALSAAWWITGHIITNPDSPLYDENPKIAAKNYGEWVSEVVHQLIEIRGYTNVKYLILLTEPNTGCWEISCERGETPGFQYYELCARAVDRQLRADHRRHLVKLVGPNAGIYGFGDPAMLGWAVKNLDDSLDIYSSHTYMDYSEQPDFKRETRSGKGSLGLSTPGFRAQQYVKLEPNTEYELSLYAKAAEGSNMADWQRGFLFGAFDIAEGEHSLITAGMEGISYLTPNSVVTIPVKELSSEWKQYTMRFQTGEKDYAYIGIFHDVIPFGGTMFYDDVSLHRVGDTAELIQNGDFEDRESIAWLAFKGGIGYTDDQLPLYSSVSLMLKRYLQYIPKGKEFWFDEYNTRFFDMYTDPRQGTSLGVVQTAFINAGVNCNLLWALFDQHWPFCKWDGFDCFIDGDHRFGIMPNLKRSKTPYPAYYAFTLISKYMGDHDSVIYKGDSGDTVCTSFVRGSDGNYSLLVVNAGEEAREIRVNFAEALHRDFHRHLFDPQTVAPDDKAEIIGIDKSFTEVTDTLTDQLPAYSLAIYSTRTD